MAVLKPLPTLGRFHDRRRIRQILAALGLGWLLPLVATAQSVGDYTTFSTTGLPGRLYVPPTQAAASTPRPFILALHGGGGIGTDNTDHLIDFDGLLAECKTRAAFLYVPQATSAYWYAGNRPTLIMDMIDQAIARYNIDPARMYITGFSMGGGGAWNLFARYADRFAAGVPIAGIVPGSGYAAAGLVDKPVWAFHARNDPTVSVQRSRNTVTAILKVSGDPAPAFPPTTDTSTTFTYDHSPVPLRYVLSTMKTFDLATQRRPRDFAFHQDLRKHELDYGAANP